jgi:excisionase family DNA binding protein
MSTNDRRLLTLGQMARRLRVPVSWLRQECEAGRIPHIRAGKAVLFNPEAVERMLLRRAERSPQAPGLEVSHRAQ